MKTLRNGKAVEKVEPPAVDVSSEPYSPSPETVALRAEHLRHYARRYLNPYLATCADTLEALAADRDRLNLGADDAATYIGEDIRAIPLPEPPPDPPDAEAIDAILERHQGAMTKADYRAAGDDIRRLLAAALRECAERDATIAALREIILRPKDKTPASRQLINLSEEEVAEKSATIARLSALLAEARAALEPFAAIAIRYDSAEFDERGVKYAADAYFTIDQLRRARAVLAKLSAKGA